MKTFRILQSRNFLTLLNTVSITINKWNGSQFLATLLQQIICDLLRKMNYIKMKTIFKQRSQRTNVCLHNKPDIPKEILIGILRKKDVS